MIVDLNLQGKKVIIIGGGNEALKRINSLLKQQCEIVVISNKINSQIIKLAESKKIKLKKITKTRKLESTKFYSFFRVFILSCFRDKNHFSFQSRLQGIQSVRIRSIISFTAVCIPVRRARDTML